MLTGNNGITGWMSLTKTFQRGDGTTGGGDGQNEDHRGFSRNLILKVKVMSSRRKAM